MDASTLGLAVIPPALAIVVEKFNPISEEKLRSSWTADLDEFKSLSNYDLLFENVLKGSSAAIEVSGLAPTIVAAVTSGFAVLHEMASPFWPTIIYLITFIALGLFMSNSLSGLSFFRIDDENYIFSNRTKLVKVVIYSVNILLISVSCAIFYFSKNA